MADFIFRISPNIVLGSYTTSRLGQFARDYGSKYIIIMDPILKEVGTSDKSFLHSMTAKLTILSMIQSPAALPPKPLQKPSNWQKKHMCTEL